MSLVIPTKLLDDLKQKGFTALPFPMPLLSIHQAMDAFFQFLAAPSELKETIHFSIAPMHRRGEVGFYHRSSNHHQYDDDKAFFHFHPEILKKYPDFIHAHDSVRNLVTLAKPIWDLVYQMIFTILTALEPLYKNAVKKVFDTSCPHILLRFLKYEWQSSGKYLAKPHYDAGALTLAIAESAPGLRMGRNPDTLKAVSHEAEHAILMLSSNFRNVIDDPTLFPVWHDVIQVDEKKIGRSYARWALVAFIEAHDVLALPRKETHRFVHEAPLPT